MTAALSPEAVDHLGFWFALTPVATGTVALVALAALYARLTGRHYPFRQFDASGQHGTEDRSPFERLGLSETELTEVLERYRQSFNLGVEDLARLIGAAELQAAAHSSGPLSAGDIMSRDLITVQAETGMGDIAELFRQHKVTSLPVVGADDRFQGVIFQLHLISRARADALRLERGYLAALRRLLGREWDKPVRAGEIMSVAGPRASTTTPVSALLPMMADSDVDAVPILDEGRLVGIVTRTDLIAAMARKAIRGA